MPAGKPNQTKGLRIVVGGDDGKLLSQKYRGSIQRVDDDSCIAGFAYKAQLTKDLEANPHVISVEDVGVCKHLPCYTMSKSLYPRRK